MFEKMKALDRELLPRLSKMGGLFFCGKDFPTS
jgi:hypothetical protein